MLLEDPQELDLEAQGQVGDLVEEKRPSLGEVEAALPVAGRAAERAADVPEKLALQELAGQSTAVDRHEGPLPARRMTVQRLRHELLAGAALAGHEHRGIAFGEVFDQPSGAPRSSSSPSACMTFKSRSRQRKDRPRALKTVERPAMMMLVAVSTSTDGGVLAALDMA